MSECKHSRIEPTLSAITSVMCIQFTIFGFKCLDCEKQWDIGNALEALMEVAQLEAENARLKKELSVASSYASISEVDAE